MAQKQPYSDFNFTLTTKVIGKQGSTGYLAEVKPETIGDGNDGDGAQSRYIII